MKNRRLMTRVYRGVQFAANIAILVLTPFVVAMVLQDFISHPPNGQNAPDRAPENSPKSSTSKPAVVNPLGKVVPIEGVNWKDNQKTLMLYLSTTCRYCNESIPFYQRLVKENRGGTTKVIGVFSQSEAEAREYLDLHKIKVDEVRSETLRSIGVTATPTLLLVNSNGVITDHWRGKLNSEKEADVVSKLGG